MNNILNNLEIHNNIDNKDNKDDIIKISGSIGMVKLKGQDKYIYIFYDDHSNKSYCKENNSIFLFDIFEEMINTINKSNLYSKSEYIILLEEPFVNNYSNIKFLWNDTPHIIKFRNFYKKVIKQCNDRKVCNVFPVDIRLIICDVSLDELLSNIDSDEYFNINNESVLSYFKQLLYLFDYIKWDEKLFQYSDSNLKFLKNVYDKYKKDKYYISLKYQFDKFYKFFIKNNLDMNIIEFLKKNNNEYYNLSNGYPFENTDESIFIYQYDKLINGLMELYIYILLTGMTYKNIIIYSGYYHSSNLVYILEKYYNFVNEYEIGNVKDIEKKDDKDISNCLYINKKIFN